MLNCDQCGRFHDHGPGSAWKMVYSGYPPEPDRELSRCRSCVEKYGPFAPQLGIRPDCSCGIVQPVTAQLQGLVPSDNVCSRCGEVSNAFVNACTFEDCEMHHFTPFNPENKTAPTFGDLLSPAMKIRDEADAKQYAEKYVTWIMENEGVSLEVARHNASVNLRYFASMAHHEGTAFYSRMFAPFLAADVPSPPTEAS